MERIKFPEVDNCSTIIVGKNASKTGKVILAHNEDTPDCTAQVHLVPRIKHKPGEVLTFADGTAVIPQVEETYAYMWSEFRALGEFGGEPFADSFFNEWGVAVASDSCVATREGTQPYTGGIGYGIRRLIAERSRSAREGVEVVAELVKEFGYRSTRSYHICDKDEAWVIQLTVGNNFVAKKVGDDEIYYIPNWLTIHEVDFSDTEHKNYYWSEDVVGYAIRNGWYTPAVEGDYSDFDYAKAYQGAGHWIKSNLDRSDLAWSQISGENPEQYRTVFSIKAPKKYGVEDLKPIMRSHYAQHGEDLKDDPTMSPHRYGICRDTTIETTITEFNDDVNLTCVWRSSPRPCAAPFVPWYLGITKLPKGYEWIDAKASQASHFAVDPSELKYDGRYAYWAFHVLQNMMEFDYQFGQDKLQSSIKALEDEWAVTKPAMDAAYKAVKEINPEYAKQMLTDYTAQQAQRAWDWASETLTEITNARHAARMHFWRSKL